MTEGKVKYKTEGGARVIKEIRHDPGGNEPNGAGSPVRPWGVTFLNGGLEVQIDVSDLLRKVIEDDVTNCDLMDLGWRFVECDGDILIFELEA